MDTWGWTRAPDSLVLSHIEGVCNFPGKSTSTALSRLLAICDIGTLGTGEIFVLMGQGDFSRFLSSFCSQETRYLNFAGNSFILWLPLWRLLWKRKNFSLNASVNNAVGFILEFLLILF